MQSLGYKMPKRGIAPIMLGAKWSLPSINGAPLIVDDIYRYQERV